MDQEYKIIGCNGCSGFFATRGHLNGRCPECGKLVFFYGNNRQRVLISAKDREEAELIMYKLTTNPLLATKIRLTKEELGIC